MEGGEAGGEAETDDMRVEGEIAGGLLRSSRSSWRAARSFVGTGDSESGASRSPHCQRQRKGEGPGGGFRGGARVTKAAIHTSLHELAQHPQHPLQHLLRQAVRHCERRDEVHRLLARDTKGDLIQSQGHELPIEDLRVGVGWVA